MSAMEKNKAGKDDVYTHFDFLQFITIILFFNFSFIYRLSWSKTLRCGLSLSFI